MMIRTIEAEKEYTRFHGQKAIDKFFAAYPELADEWKETIEWMMESNTEHFIDDLMADGIKNEWSYSIWFQDEEDFTYICIIERA